MDLAALDAEHDDSNEEDIPSSEQKEVSEISFSPKGTREAKQ